MTAQNTHAAEPARRCSGSRMRGRSGAGCIGLLVLALSTPLGRAAQGIVPPEFNEPAAQAAQRRLALVALVAELDRAPAEGFQEAARQVVARAGVDGRAALVLVAGRGVPVGLSTAREAERRAQREAARAVLAEDRAATAALLECLLERPSGAEAAAPVADPAGAPTAPCSHPALRASAATLVGAFGLHALAPRVAGLLDLAEEPTTIVAARGALHTLHGRWYPGRAAFQALWPRLAGKGPEELFLDELAERERTAEERLLALLGAQPAEHLVAAFAEPNPVLRARVAETVARAVADRSIGLDEAWTRLCAQLALEPSPVASGAILAALLELLQGAPGNDSRVTDLRAGLVEMAARRASELEDLALRALPRLPPVDGNGAAVRDLEFASGLAVSMLDGSRPFDPDLVTQGLTAFGATARRVADPALRRAACGGVPERLRAIVEGRFGVAARVRVAAADALAAVLTAADIDVLLDTFRASEEPSVRYRLLGVLADAAALVEAGSGTKTGERRIAEALVSAAESPEAAVRTRAVELLADPRVASALAAARAHDPGFDRRLVELLRGPAGDLERVALLDVLAGAGRRELCALLLRGDTLRPLATGAPQVLEALVRALQRLAGDDTQQVWSAADLLTLELPGLQETERPSRPRRVAAALRLVLGLSEEAARRLTPPQHAAVLAWFLELRAPGNEPGEPVPMIDPAGRQRIAGSHAALAGPTAEGDAADSARAAAVARALLAVDGLGEGATPLERGAVLALLDTALGAARGAAGAVQPSEVARLEVERARLADALERSGEAERDLSAALAAVPEVLTGRDLRRLATLAQAGGRDATAAAALGHAVRRSVWRTRPSELRLTDLEALVDAVLAARDTAAAEALRAALADVPPLPEGEATFVEPAAQGQGAAANAPLWAGLPSAGRAEHARLLALAKRLTRPATGEPARAAGGGNPAPGTPPSDGVPR